jgi:hypothetical protein
MHTMPNRARTSRPLLLALALLVAFAAAPAHAAADKQAPSAPAQLTATPGSKSITLTWTASTDNVGVRGYNVWRRLASGTTWSRIAQVTKLSYTDTKVQGDTRYVYGVRAYDAAGNVSDSSPLVTAAADPFAPTAPTALTATPTSSTIALAWSPSTDNVGVAGYYVERRLSSSTSWSRVGQSPTTSYVDSGMKLNTSYAYRVQAYDAVGNRSGYSSSITSQTVALTQEPAEAEGATVSESPTSPEPEVVPEGSIVWRADGESVFDQEWASVSTQTSCGRTLSSGMVDARFQRVSAPAAKGAGAYQSHLQDGDECYGERSETGQGNPTRSSFSDRLFREGEERWISWQVRLGAGFPINVNTWQVVAQWKQLGSLGIPVLSMEARGGGWRFYANPADPNATSGFKTFVLGPAALERWTRFTMHVRFSPDPSVGFIELYGDLADGKGMRQLIARTQTSTMKFDPAKNNQTVDSHARLGIYRDKAISGPADVFYDGYTVATSRAAAEANAF